MSWYLLSLVQVGDVGSWISMETQQLKHSPTLMQLFYHMLGLNLSFQSSEMSWMQLASAFQRSRTPTQKLLWEHSYSHLAWMQLEIPKLLFPPPKRAGILCTSQVVGMKFPCEFLSLGPAAVH